MAQPKSYVSSYQLLTFLVNISVSLDVLLVKVCLQNAGAVGYKGFWERAAELLQSFGSVVPLHPLSKSGRQTSGVLRNSARTSKSPTSFWRVTFAQKL
jgi:hypothetical protein